MGATVCEDSSFGLNIIPFTKYIKIMKIKGNKSYGIVSTDIIDVNNKEMQQMYELKNHLKNILDSHKEGSEKKEYASDDDLTLMHAILSVFTKEYESTQVSAFDDFLKEAEKPQQQEEKIEDEPIIDPYKD